MNKRIEKLLEQVQVNEQVRRIAKQAGCTIDRLGYGEGNLEEFAELIVKECMKVAHVHSEGSELHDEGTLYYYMEDIAVKIKQHFGVEE